MLTEKYSHFSSKNKTKNIIALAVLILFGIFIVTFGVFIAYDKKNNGFTELYFHGELPKHITMDEKYGFIFIIHNVENKEMKYLYEVFQESNLIKQGVVLLKHDEKDKINCDFVVTEQPKKNPLNISVKLGNNQDIQYWVYLE
jgi:hypothetical protein